jgi:hypothetical protein
MEPKSPIEKIDRLVRFFKKFNEMEEIVIKDFPIYDPNKDLLGFLNSFFIARFYYFSKSILLLLPSLKNDFYFKVPIGILLRTGVSDILTYYYFKYLAETCKNEIAFNDELKGYLVGNLHFIKNQYLWQKKRHQISEAKYKDLLSNLYWKYGEFIDPITSEFIPNKNINFGEIAAKLRSYERLAWVSEAFDFYDILSKYEHIGAFTFDLQEIHNVKPDYDINTYSLCCTLFYEATVDIMHLYGFDKKYKRRISNINKILITK